MKFGRLTLIERAKSDNKAVFLCDCGVTKRIDYYNVRAGRTVSCGCRLIETQSPTHGLSKTGTYQTWENMHNRCNPNNKQNKNSINSYGGIFVCDEWCDFSVFHRDMGDRPDKCSIDRINGEMGYFKENCRWVSRKKQQNNIKSNHYIESMGMVMTVSEWSVKNGTPVSTICMRISRGVPESIAIENRRISKAERLGCAAIIVSL